MYIYYCSLQVIWKEVSRAYGKNTSQNVDKLALSRTKGLLGFADLIECAGLNKFESYSEKDEFETEYKELLDWSTDSIVITKAKDLLYCCWLQWLDPSSFTNLDELLEPSLTSFEWQALEDLTGLSFLKKQ